MADAKRELRLVLEALGFSLIRKNKHEVWKHIPTGASLTVSSTASDRRAFKNVIGNARRSIRNAESLKQPEVAC